MRPSVPRVAVDAVLLHRGKLVLVRRGRPPFLGRYALPGGGVEFGEPLEDAVRREVLEETGLQAEIVRLLGVYGAPDRDPRGHTISVAYVLRSAGGRLRAGTDAAATSLVPVDGAPPLAFDHTTILADFRRSRRRPQGGGGARSQRAEGRWLTTPRPAASTSPSQPPGHNRPRRGARSSP